MEEKKRNPKVEFPTNTPVTVTFDTGKPFKEGDTDYGHWWGFGVSISGQPHTLFADEGLIKHLEGIGKGDTLTIAKREKKLDNGKKTYYWDSAKPLFDDKGNQPPPPAPDLVKDATLRDEFIAEYEARLNLYLAAATRSVKLHNSTISDGDMNLLMDREDIRSFAITGLIELSKKSR